MSVESEDSAYWEQLVSLASGMLAKRTSRKAAVAIGARRTLRGPEAADEATRSFETAASLLSRLSGSDAERSRSQLSSLLDQAALVAARDRELAAASAAVAQEYLRTGLDYLLTGSSDDRLFREAFRAYEEVDEARAEASMHLRSFARAAPLRHVEMIAGLGLPRQRRKQALALAAHATAEKRKIFIHTVLTWARECEA